MDSTIIKSHQCSLERSYAALIILILNSDQGLAIFRQKQILRGLLVTNRTMKISLFNYSMLGYIQRITTSLPPYL